MDNITNFTIALRAYRNRHPNPEQRFYHRNNTYTRAKRRQENFARWIDSKSYKFYVFYRVSGTGNLHPSSTVKTKLSLLPMLSVSDEPGVYALFTDYFTLYAQIQEVTPYNQEWTSITAIADSFPAQQPVPVVPDAYLKYYDSKIKPKIILPHGTLAYIKKDGVRQDIKQNEEQFYRFHMYYHNHPQDINYGVINQMWNIKGNEIEVTPPPEFTIGAPDPTLTPKDNALKQHFLNPAKATVVAPRPSLDPELESFLKSYRSSVSLWKR